MPLQILAKLALVFGILILTSHILKFGKNKFFQASISMTIIFVYFRYRVYHRFPFLWLLPQWPSPG